MWQFPLGHIAWSLYLLPLWLSSSHVPSRTTAVCLAEYRAARGRILSGAGRCRGEDGAVQSSARGGADVGGAVLLSRRRDAEAALRAANSSLEMRVAERQTSLMNANSRLSQQLVEQQQVEAALREPATLRTSRGRGGRGVWEWGWRPRRHITPEMEGTVRLYRVRHRADNGGLGSVNSS